MSDPESSWVSDDVEMGTLETPEVGKAVYVFWKPGMF